ncbi:MAG: NADH-quinone oxidoreductase subunit A [Candidatus Omnitrophica bacterium CG11_big_fil_rev_8_21_14_0_20_63_9]|nr:MAG: NADH-quinone oxidoreductase subunit A [Candidatus Omnitrophica bacterium CG11_big_fil_rev_8_21_14_0_20_63_9]
MSAYTEQYLFIGLLTAVALFLGGFPLLVAKLVAPKKPGLSKQAPYECGLESTGEPWLQFRIQYYIYALLFVVFDVEVIFLYPWAVTFKELAPLLGPIVLAEMLLFIAILGVALVYAWKKGVLEWE